MKTKNILATLLAITFATANAGERNKDIRHQDSTEIGGSSRVAPDFSPAPPPPPGYWIPAMVGLGNQPPPGMPSCPADLVNYYRYNSRVPCQNLGESCVAYGQDIGDMSGTYWFYGGLCKSEATPAPINGVCGSANGTSTPTAPTGAANLCSKGTATAVSGLGPWSWSCNGLNGGTTASCSANIQTGGRWSSAVAGGCTKGMGPGHPSNYGITDFTKITHVGSAGDAYGSCPLLYECRYRTGKGWMQQVCIPN